MTRDDAVKMALKAGFGDHFWYTTDEDEFIVTERFAALVAAHEREQCAKVCEARYMGDNSREDMEARRCAEAIRKRGGK
jgi:hypothetical protein